MTREPTYGEAKSQARKGKKDGVPQLPKRLTRIEKAIESTTPGSALNPASHEEVMAYLRTVLIPALADIAARIQLDSEPDSVHPLTKEERKSFSLVWDRVSDIVRTRRPRNQDAPLMLLGKLLAETKVISPAAVHVWAKTRFVPPLIDPPQ